MKSFVGKARQEHLNQWIKGAEMGWFDHHHYWKSCTGLNTVINPETQKATSARIIEECDCGAVRTIEYAPGIAPVVRYATEIK